MKITKACLQFLFLLMPAGGIHADKAEAEVVSVRVDDKFGSADKFFYFTFSRRCFFNKSMYFFYFLYLHFILLYDIFIVISLPIFHQMPCLIILLKIDLPQLQIFATEDILYISLIRGVFVNQENIELISRNNFEKALQVIEKSGVRRAWESIGAAVNQVGSMAMGLLMKHRDIDFHIYTEKLDISESFEVIRKICANPAVTRMEYRNLADTEEACLEFHIWFMLNNEEWQIDMIQIEKGSQFDGFFERVSQRIKEVLTPEKRRTILELKYLTPDNEHIMGIEYYQAVIADGIRTYPEFIQWRKNHPVTGIVNWTP